MSRSIPELPADLPALLVTHLPNVRALSGFTGTSAFLLVGPAHRTLLTEFRYVTQAASEAPGWVVEKTEKGLAETLGRMTLPARIGFESAHLPVESLRKLEEKTKEKTEWVATKDLVEKVRAVKSPGEIDRLRRAEELLEEGFARLLPTIRAGETEEDVARRFLHWVIDATGAPPPFDPIVASGLRGALPHGRASSKVIARGELVTCDLGLVLDGWNADMTRTVGVGRVDARSCEVHDAVRCALEAAQAPPAAGGIRPGMTGEEAHAIAARVLDAAGLGEVFGHGLGHGVGIEIHEDPRVAPNAREILTAGMVFTVEPGAYLPDWGGVRIEDCGVLTEEGFSSFNRSARGLEIVG